jgi:hypothetical protein
VIDVKAKQLTVSGQKIYLPELEQKYDFNEGFHYCARTLRKKTREDYDAVVGITGDEGVSKSTLANHLGFNTDKAYTFEKNCLFSPNEQSMVDAIRKLPRFSTVNADEAIKILYKQQWWLQVFINKFYRLCRQDNKISILCMPRFSEFNEGFRNHRILIWIHLLDRGIGVVFMKDWNVFSKDPWNMKENEKLIQKYTKRQKYFQVSLERKINILKKSPNFVDSIEFPDLPEKLRIEYKALAAKHKYVGMDDELVDGRRRRKTEDKWKTRISAMKRILKERTGMTDKQLSEAMKPMIKTSRPVVSRW